MNLHDDAFHIYSVREVFIECFRHRIMITGMLRILATQNNQLKYTLSFMEYSFLHKWNTRKTESEKKIRKADIECETTSRSHKKVVLAILIVNEKNKDSSNPASKDNGSCQQIMPGDNDA